MAAVAVLLVLGIGFAVGLVVHSHREAAARQASSDASDATPAVDVVTVRATDRTYPLALPGQTAGWDQSPLYARVDGYVGTWAADIGDPVKAGQVLATIDTPDLDQQSAAARAKAAASDAQVAVAQSNESIAQLTYDRWRDSPRGVVSEQEREEKQANYAAAKAHLAEARAQAQLDQAEVSRYAALESFRQVTAPYAGIVTARNVDIGDLVTAGSSSATRPLYSVARVDWIRTFVDVPQKAAADMVVGLEATATSDQFPGRAFRGKIARSSRSIDPQSRTQRTEVDIPNPDGTLLPGMYVQVTFQLNQRGLLQVPAAAILFKPGGLQVAVVDAQNRVDFAPVTVAKDDGDTVELASGVAPNDRVALNISNDVAPGQQVTAVDVDKEHPAAAPPPAPPAPAVETSGPPSGNGFGPASYTPVPDAGNRPPDPATPPLPALGTGKHLIPGQSVEPSPAPQPPVAPRVNVPASGAGAGSAPP